MHDTVKRNLLMLCFLFSNLSWTGNIAATHKPRFAAESVVQPLEAENLHDFEVPSLSCAVVTT